MHYYELFQNTLPHDRAEVENRIRRKWDEKGGDSVERRQTAEKFFHDRAAGKIQGWLSFVDQQKEGMLPAGWDPTQRNIVIFNSSEDEFASIGPDWKNPLYPTQRQGLSQIIESLRLRDDGTFHVYLRIHPNLKGIMNEEVLGLWKLQAPFLTLLAPEDPVSTYALLQNAEKVLTFGSTVGIEAVFFGRPSILAGMSFYRNLGGTYNPASHGELVDMLGSDLSPKDLDAALMYGHYMQTYGIPFRHYRADSLFSGKFKGIQLGGRKSRFQRLAGDRLYRKVAGAKQWIRKMIETRGGGRD